MKHRIGIFLGLVLSTSLTVTAASCQNSLVSTPSPTSSPDFRKGDVVDYRKDATGKVVPIKREVGVLKGLDTPYIDDPEFWMSLGIACAAGILGGFVAELIRLNGNIERLHQPSDDEGAANTSSHDVKRKNEIDLGIFATLSIGGLAAPAAMVFLKPVSVFGLFGMSVIAGSAGTAIFIALQERVRTAIAAQQNAVAIAVADEEKKHAQEPLRQEKLKQNAPFMLKKLNDAAIKLEEIEKELRVNSEIDSNNPDIMKFPNKAKLHPDDFAKVWKPLNEVKGIDAHIGSNITQYFKKLEQAIRNVSESPEGEGDIIIKPGSSLNLEVFNQVKKRLNEAMGEIEAIEAIDASS